MRFKSIILIDTENAKVNLELWKHHFTKQKWNTIGTFKDVFKENIHTQNCKKEKRNPQKKKKKEKGFLRL